MVTGQQYGMSRRRGFTLVELLVVVSVLALLISILVPSLRRARMQAKRTVCSSNLRQIGIAFVGYLSENNDRFPHASFMPSVDPFPVSGEDPIYLSEVMRSYLNMGEVGDADDESFDVDEASIFRCPSDKPNSKRLGENQGLSYYESERSSYEYRCRRPNLGGRTINEVALRIGKHVERPVSVNSIWVLRDYWNFHYVGSLAEYLMPNDEEDEEDLQAKSGARRYLYVDGRVTDFEDF